MYVQMTSVSLPRGSFVDVVVPGVPVARTPHGSDVMARLRDLALVIGGALLIIFCLWLDERSLAHQTMVLGGGWRLDARTAVANTVLAVAMVVLVGLSARLDVRVLARDAALVAGGVLLLALGAHVTIPLKPVPITGQTFAVLLLAAALGWRRGYTTVILYIVLGTAGLPIFAAVSSAVTYGYLAGFALAALVVGWLAERGWDRAVVTSLGAMLLGEVAIYACGLPWLAQFAGWDVAIRFGLLPFLIGDGVKLALAAALLPAAWRFTGHMASKRV